MTVITLDPNDKASVNEGNDTPDIETEPQLVSEAVNIPLDSYQLMAI